MSGNFLKIHSNIYTNFNCTKYTFFPALFSAFFPFFKILVKRLLYWH